MYEEMSDDKSRSSVKDQINENLRRVYEETLKEEVPDRFKLLLEQLRAKGGSE